MPILHLSNPHSILLALTLPSIYTRWRLGQDLKHIVNYGTWRWISVRRRRRYGSKKKSQMASDEQSWKEDRPLSHALQLRSLFKSLLSSSKTGDSGKFGFRKEKFSGRVKYPVLEIQKALNEHQDILMNCFPHDQNTSTELNREPRPLESSLSILDTFVLSAENENIVPSPLKLRKKGIKSFKANPELPIKDEIGGGPLGKYGAIPKAENSPCQSMACTTISNYNPVFSGSGEYSHPYPDLSAGWKNSQKSLIFLPKYSAGQTNSKKNLVPGIRKMVFNADVYSDVNPEASMIQNHDLSSSLRSKEHLLQQPAFMRSRVISDRLSMKMQFSTTTVRRKLEIIKSFKKDTQPDLSKGRQSRSKTDRQVPSQSENPRVNYDESDGEKGNSNFSNLKLSAARWSQMIIGQNVSKKNQALMKQNLYGKRRNQTAKPNDLTESTRDKMPLVEIIARPTVEHSSLPEEKLKLVLAPKHERPIARNHELLHLSGSSEAGMQELSAKSQISFPMHGRLTKNNNKNLSTGTQLSLLEELFPEEIGKAASSDSADESDEAIPRLPPPEFEDEDEIYGDAQKRLSEEDRMATVASKQALHQWNLAVLVINRASKSLSEGDFRRIAPRGQHISEWRGVGDFLKVIPARDQSTLRHAGHYFLLFPNPAYARAYQSHVISLHRIARTHTPTSIESPMSPPPGMLVEGEDVYSVLQNYALCPPSQKISLRIVFPPYAPALKRLLELRGYPQIMRPEDKSCKSVLFWVDGFQPTIHDIREMISRDKRSRGLNWALANTLKPVEKVDSSAAREWEEAEFGATEAAETTQFRGLYPRYLIHFADENEARRFTRAWHRRPFPVPNEMASGGEPPPLVHAEFVW